MEWAGAGPVEAAFQVAFLGVALEAPPHTLPLMCTCTCLHIMSTCAGMFVSTEWEEGLPLRRMGLLQLRAVGETGANLGGWELDGLGSARVAWGWQVALCTGPGWPTVGPAGGTLSRKL